MRLNLHRYQGLSFLTLIFLIISQRTLCVNDRISSCASMMEKNT